MTTRTATIDRATRETRISLTLALDGTGQASIDSGLGFLDHMLTAFALHAGFDLRLTCEGDLHVDDHHTAEDCALALGAAFTQAIGDKKGITRFASAYAPLDEALARAVVDISGRPFSHVELLLGRDMLGDIACENIAHFFRSFASGALLTLHIDVLRSMNDHHAAEASFKALALALREAVAVDPSQSDVPSTKGSL